MLLRCGAGQGQGPRRPQCVQWWLACTRCLLRLPRVLPYHARRRHHTTHNFTRYALPLPLLLRLLLQGERVSSVACGSEHSLAATEAGTVRGAGGGLHR